MVIHHWNTSNIINYWIYQYARIRPYMHNLQERQFAYEDMQERRGGKRRAAAVRGEHDEREVVVCLAVQCAREQYVAGARLDAERPDARELRYSTGTGTRPAASTCTCASNSVSLCREVWTDDHWRLLATRLWLQLQPNEHPRDRRDRCPNDLLSGIQQLTFRALMAQSSESVI